MAKIIQESISAHRSIYTEKSKDRELLILYSLPENGVTEETGMLVIIPGYGGGFESNVYRHIREDFSDKYNLVVVQCDYFGSEYMQSKIPEELERFASDDRVTGASVTWTEKLGEDLEDFNDMGMMQALDIVTVSLYVLTQVDIINTNRIMIFGTSHGGYLAHLSNVICPGLFSHLIDVCGYIMPYYLDHKRWLGCKLSEDIAVRIVYDYLVKKNSEVRYYNNLYSLEYLYSKLNNRCHIMAVQGTQDWMFDYREKLAFIQSIPNAEILLIDEEDVDGVLFKDANHGVGLDFIKFLELYIPIIDDQMVVCNDLIIDEVVCIGDDMRISYRNNRPKVEYIRFE